MYQNKQTRKMNKQQHKIQKKQMSIVSLLKKRQHTKPFRFENQEVKNTT